MTAFLLVLLCAIASYGIYDRMPRYHGPHGYNADVLNAIGPEAVDIIAHADRLDVIRVDGSTGLRRDVEVSQYEGLKTPRLVDDCIYIASRSYGPGAQLTTARNLVLDRAAYGGLVSACEIEPGLVVRFWQGKRHRDALICFRCELADVWDGKTSIVDSASGSLTPNWEAWLAFARQVYPRDARFKSLPSHSPHAREYYKPDASSSGWNQIGNCPRQLMGVYTAR